MIFAAWRYLRAWRASIDAACGMHAGWSCDSPQWRAWDDVMRELDDARARAPRWLVRLCEE